jgi:hypothetical protein
MRVGSNTLPDAVGSVAGTLEPPVAANDVEGAVEVVGAGETVEHPTSAKVNPNASAPPRRRSNVGRGRAIAAL